MHFTLDNIAATLVAAVVLLILLTVQHRGREAAIDHTVHYSARAQVHSLIDTIERDFVNIGTGVPTAESKIMAFSEDSLTFRRRMAPEDAIQTITYRRIPVDTVEVETYSTVLYRVERLVDGQFGGGSMATLQEFKISLLDNASNPVPLSDLQLTRLIRVEFTAGFPLADGQYLKETRWAGTFTPANLAR